MVSSPALGADATREAAWAGFFETLPHGPELGALNVMLADPLTLATRCGSEADGCYLDLPRVIVMPGTALPDGGEADEVARHEYGHHLAAQSDNAPFTPGLGTKRWFTYEHVCQRLRSGELSDRESDYQRSVAEGFAEAYRVTAGGQAHEWIVDPALYPDTGARRAILADAAHPWTGPHVRTLSGRLPRTVRVPLDGTVTVSSLGRSVALADPSGHLLARGRRFSYVDCGLRRLRLTGSGAAAGRYRVRVGTP